MRFRYTLALVLLSCLARSAAAQPAGWTLTPASAMQKLTATAPGVLERYNSIPVQLHAARGEHECFQIVVTAGDTPLSNVQVKTPVVGMPSGSSSRVAGNAAISAQTYWENYVYINSPSGNRRIEKLWWPDALIPTQQADKPVTRTIASHQSAVLFVDLNVPAYIGPGPYTGAVTVTATDGNAPAAEQATPAAIAEMHTDFSIEVSPATLPSPTMHANAALYYDLLREWYTKNLHPLSEDEFAALKKKYYDFLLDYRINAYDLPVSWNSKEAADYLRNPNVVSVRLPQINSPEFRPALNLLKANRVLDKSYYYWLDEPSPERYAEVRETTKKLHAIDPRLKQTVTAHPNLALKDAVDIWCPNVGDYFGLGQISLTQLAAEREAGRQTWWYTMAVPRAPYPTWLIDDDASSVRLYGWMMARWDINGFVYSMVHGWGPKPLEDIRSFADTNGDGTLVYPAELVGGSGPMPSIRLMLLRDSIEDYELLRTLSPKARAMVTAPVVGKTPSERIDTQTAWERGYYRDALFAQLNLLTTKAPAIPAPPLLPIPFAVTKGNAPLTDLQSDSYRQDVTFQRFAGETVSSSPGLWLAHNGAELLVAMRAPRIMDATGEWFAVELAPDPPTERWRFVVTGKGNGVVEKHTREGHYLMKGVPWKFSLKPGPGGAYVDVRMRIPLSVIGNTKLFRFNALSRRHEDSTGIFIIRRAFPDDGNVTRMPTATLKPAPGRKADAAPAK